MPMFVALIPIDAGGVRAYNPGDHVHPDNVASNGYVIGQQVAEADSEQAVAALRSLGLIPSDAPQDDAQQNDTRPGEWAGPAEYTVAEVNAYLDDHPDEVAAVLAEEKDGKARAGILHGPHGTAADVAEA